LGTWHQSLSPSERIQGQVLASAMTSSVSKEIIRAHPVEIACFYHFSTTVPERRKYAVGGLGEFYLRDLDRKNWNLTERTSTNSVLSR
jgi:hypothetical protein